MPTAPTTLWFRSRKDLPSAPRRLATGSSGHVSDEGADILEPGGKRVHAGVPIRAAPRAALGPIGRRLGAGLGALRIRRWSGRALPNLVGPGDDLAVVVLEHHLHD